MKYLLAVSILAVLLYAAAPFGRAQTGPNRPPGIPAEAWIQLGPDAGFVVDESAAAPKFGRDSPAASGYFMGRYKGFWMRLEPGRLGAIVPAT